MVIHNQPVGGRKKKVTRKYEIGARILFLSSGVFGIITNTSFKNTCLELSGKLCPSERAAREVLGEHTKKTIK